ncbi:hypothetical protein [Lactobacillus delbrueckii]|uniref:hypothetical protein n=1 Tax=Lactobacillus delbrueckii TaxID=1584 RepID=UPI001E298CFD|nr:hypothetical protein [Lactobacillus delbrueckii]MCD5528445.1 hypothetical protein [Lactobacillus delbrueckii subsp. lactis]MCD5595136.1 hypothetical protein [Lactobacillus delbrueckii subsp. lactis]
MTPNLTAFTGVDSQNLPDVMVSVQFILAIGGQFYLRHHVSKELTALASSPLYIVKEKVLNDYSVE